MTTITSDMATEPSDVMPTHLFDLARDPRGRRFAVNVAVHDGANRSGEFARSVTDQYTARLHAGALLEPAEACPTGTHLGSLTPLA